MLQVGTEFITLNLEVKRFYFTALTAVAPPDSAFLFQKLLLFHFMVKSLHPLHGQIPHQTPKQGLQTQQNLSLTRINHIKTKYPNPRGRPAKPGLKLSSLKATRFRLSYSFWKCSDFENTEHLHFPILTIGKCKKKKNQSFLRGKKIKTSPHCCPD